jgi:hypothetical protein
VCGGKPSESPENERRPGESRRSEYKVSVRRPPAMWRDGVHRRPRRHLIPRPEPAAARPVAPDAEAPGSREFLWLGAPVDVASGSRKLIPFGSARAWMWLPCDGNPWRRTACSGPSQAHATGQ